MAKVAIVDSSSKSFPFASVVSKVQADATMKRKTPSELRGEQLKRRKLGEPNGSLHFSSGSDRPKKSDPSNLPKCTRLNDVYPVRKSSRMLKVLYGKENTEDSFPFGEHTKDSSIAAPPSHISCEKSGAPNISNNLIRSVKEKSEECYPQVEKCSQSTFRTVAELSVESKRSSGPTIIDMDKALKGLVARDLPNPSCSTGDSHGRSDDILSIFQGNASSEVNILGHKTPLDLTLKKTIRLVSSSSVSWCHRLSIGTAYTSTTHFGWSLDQSVGNSLKVSPAENLFLKALHSWVYPQSSLPPSVISAIALSASGRETDFLLKRQLAWEDSFRSLYYMLRKDKCDIFYFYTSQFVVLFIGGNFPGLKNRSCNAYLSQSTRGLRSLLREHDICFSMPFCRSEVEHDSVDDLAELLEIEKHNLGQTRRLDSMSDVDNSSVSLLAFIGSENVHGLYDFLLNYRSFLSSLTANDVPVLYSPVTFQNASLFVPEVRCKEMKKADAVICPTIGHPPENGDILDSSSMCYSIEIKDTVVPPWTVSGLCAAMGYQGRSFEASFVMEPISTGLNVAIDTLCHKVNPPNEQGKDVDECSNTLGIQEAVVAPCLRSASLRGLKYSNGSYRASLSPL